ncbi:cytochrome P450 [Daedalea quercina L-15889]|uniref:Cytochrome P450 n=1 Tax=Daedalea quercina L-15889 TaxID=1314783 RepID=A0A165SPI2_9APHY|nr:cytochrome P450 [Daedalea quercina L-15889]
MPDVMAIAGAVVGVLVSTILVRWRFDPLHIGSTKLPVRSFKKVTRRVFRVSLPDQWIVIISGADMNDELRKIPDSHASFQMAVDELTSTRYTISESFVDHPIQVTAIRGPLTKHLAVVLDTIGSKMHGEEWMSVNVLMAMAVIISRASNCVFVGLPSYRTDSTSSTRRNEGYLQGVRQLTFDVRKGRLVLGWSPRYLKGIVGWFIPWARRAARKVSVYLRPIIKERQRKLQDMGKNWIDKPNDYLMWVMDEANRQGVPTKNIIDSIMVSNVTAIHTLSNSITQAVYQLADSPEYATMLREEVENVVKEHGWTKVSMGKMRKLESFMRESQRINVSVMRKILKDVTLSNGTSIPAGTVVVGASTATHCDARNHENPEVFDPLRFAETHTEEGEAIKHHFVSTSPDPGRSFAANELKVMMAYILLHYDIKLEGNGRRPEHQFRSSSR